MVKELMMAALCAQASCPGKGAKGQQMCLGEIQVWTRIGSIPWSKFGWTRSWLQPWCIWCKIGGHDLSAPSSIQKLVMALPWFGLCCHCPPPATTRDLFIDGCSLMAENAN